MIDSNLRDNLEDNSFSNSPEIKGKNLQPPKNQKIGIINKQSEGEIKITLRIQILMKIRILILIVIIVGIIWEIPQKI